MAIPLYAEFRKSLSESFSFSDSKLNSITRILSESFNVAEDHEGLKPIPKTLSESFNLTDLKILSIIKVLSDNLSISDGEVYNVARILSESFSFADADLKNIQRILSDNLSLSDAYSRVWSLARTHPESLSLSEDDLKQIYKTLSEGYTLTDSKIFSITKPLLENFSLLDNLIKSWTAKKILSETTNLTDLEYMSLLRELSESLSLDDGDMTFTYEMTLDESFGLTDKFFKTIYDYLKLINAREDLQSIITEHGIEAELIRQTEDTKSMGDVFYVGEKGYRLYLLIQDITKKDRQIHEMGLAVPGNSKAYFYHEYPDSITGNGTMSVQTGDIIVQDDKQWRIEQIISERKMQGREVFRTGILKKIDLNQ